MGQPLEVILEKDGRLRLLNTEDLKDQALGRSFTIRIVGIDEAAKDYIEAMNYTLASQPTLAEFWEDEPDGVWGDL